MGIKIGELAKRTGCEIVTIRYYEKEGLMPAPPRSEGNFRLYDDTHIERLGFIRNCRSLDMTLKEVRTLLELRDAPAQECSEVNAMLDKHLREVEVRVETLLRLKQNLVSLREECSGVWQIDSCPILKGLAGRG